MNATILAALALPGLSGTLAHVVLAVLVYAVASLTFGVLLGRCLAVGGDEQRVAILRENDDDGRDGRDDDGDDCDDTLRDVDGYAVEFDAIVPLPSSMTSPLKERTHARRRQRIDRPRRAHPSE